MRFCRDGLLDSVKKIAVKNGLLVPRSLYACFDAKFEYFYFKVNSNLHLVKSHFLNTVEDMD